MRFVLLNAEDYPLSRLLQRRPPAAARIGEGETERATTEQAKKLMLAALGQEPLNNRREVVKPVLRKDGQVLQRVVIVDTEGQHRPKVFRPEWAEGTWAWRELCRKHPACVVARAQAKRDAGQALTVEEAELAALEPVQHPSTGRKVIHMCNACRKAAGPSDRARQTLAANNRKRAGVKSAAAPA